MEEFIAGRDFGDEHNPDFERKLNKLIQKRVKYIQRELDYAFSEKDEDLFEMIKDQIDNEELRFVEFDTVESIQVSYNEKDQRVDFKIKMKHDN